MKELIKGILKRFGIYTFLFQKVYENRLLPDALRCSWRYRRLHKVAKRKPKNEKIRVLFIVSEIAKWKEQELYVAMARSGQFEPIVGISAWNNQGEGLPMAEYAKVVERAEAFFDKMDCRHVRTVTIEAGEGQGERSRKRVYHDLREFKPDIVFYTEQWSPCPHQDPREVSQFALTCFLPYYVPDFGIMSIDCHQPVERFCDTYFCLGDSWVKAYRRNMWLTAHSCRYVATGIPALDKFNRESERKPKESYVIYAPHFSFPHPTQLDFYLIGTFDWNGRQILEYAEAHPEFKWVFKPHPVLRKKLHETGIMTDAEIEEYYARWAKISVVSTDADYQNLFLESRVMITDCGSFLPEYGSTGRPVIRLICAANKHIPPKAAKAVYDTYYQARNLDEMYAVFEKVIEKGEDPNREQRLAAVRAAGLTGKNASENIVKYLNGVFGRG